MCVPAKMQIYAKINYIRWCITATYTHCKTKSLREKNVHTFIACARCICKYNMFVSVFDCNINCLKQWQ